ncbi:MAG TPA: CBS domain-containing protein [Patescibacteria group bacterium]|nr:CBS domain-containing protein [Patescibacteria group bacterium]
MLVKEVMIKNVITLKANQTLAQVAEIFVEKNISGAPVLGRGNKLIGIISEKDLFKALYPDSKDILLNIKLWFEKEKTNYKVEKKKKMIIKDLMTKEVVSIGEEDAILKAGALMLSTNIHRLPVLRDGKLVGIVSRRDIFRKLLKEKFDL